MKYFQGNVDKTRDVGTLGGKLHHQVSKVTRASFRMNLFDTLCISGIQFKYPIRVALERRTKV